MSIKFRKVCGYYEDGAKVIVTGNTEDECRELLLLEPQTRKHGHLLYFTGVTDEDYVEGIRRVG